MRKHGRSSVQQPLAVAPRRQPAAAEKGLVKAIKDNNNEGSVEDLIKAVLKGA